MEFKLRSPCSSFFLIICIVVLMISTFGSRVLGDQGEQYKMEEDRNAPENPSLWGMTKNAFSLYTSSPWRVPTYLEKIKTLRNQVQAYFFPPNIDFRGSSENIEGEGGSSGGGAGEKVKEVVGKSFGKSKSTVEDSAKSAANIVGEAVQKTKEKVKRSFSEGENRGTEPQSEL